LSLPNLAPGWLGRKTEEEWEGRPLRNERIVSYCSSGLDAAFAVQVLTGTYYADAIVSPHPESHRQDGGLRPFAKTPVSRIFASQFCSVRIYLLALGVCRLPPLESIFWELRSNTPAKCMCYLAFFLPWFLSLLSSSPLDFGVASSLPQPGDI
jgi:hypothetical protein